MFVNILFKEKILEFAGETKFSNICSIENFEKFPFNRNFLSKKIINFFPYKNFQIFFSTGSFEKFSFKRKFLK